MRAEIRASLRHTCCRQSRSIYSTVASQQEGPGFKSFLQELRFLLPSKRAQLILLSPRPDRSTRLQLPAAAAGSDFVLTCRE